MSRQPAHIFYAQKIAGTYIDREKIEIYLTFLRILGDLVFLALA